MCSTYSSDQHCCMYTCSYTLEAVSHCNISICLSPHEMSSEFFFADDMAVCLTADSFNSSVAGLDTCPLNTVPHTVAKIDD